MATPAPPPVFNSHGNLQRPWTLVCRYDDVRDALTLSWSRPGTEHQRATQGALAFPVGQLGDLQEAFERTVRMLHTPRLF